MVTEGIACQDCGAENPAGSQTCRVCGASVAVQPTQAPPKLRRRWIVGLLILGGLMALGLVSLVWAANVRRHKAATYGIADPAGAALRIENRTNDFAVARVAIESAEAGAFVRETPVEIAPGAAGGYGIEPGTYRVTVSYVEIKQVVGFRPKGSVTIPFTVFPARAVIVSLQGGRSSPESLLFIPPELVLK